MIRGSCFTLVHYARNGHCVPSNAVFRILRVVTRSRFPATSWGWRPVRQTSLEDGAASCHDGAVFPRPPSPQGRPHGCIVFHPISANVGQEGATSDPAGRVALRLDPPVSHPRGLETSATGRVRRRVSPRPPMDVRRRPEITSSFSYNGLRHWPIAMTGACYGHHRRSNRPLLSLFGMPASSEQFRGGGTSCSQRLDRNFGRTKPSAGGRLLGKAIRSRGDCPPGTDHGSESGYHPPRPIRTEEPHNPVGLAHPALGWRPEAGRKKNLRRSWRLSKTCCVTAWPETR